MKKVTYVLVLMFSLVLMSTSCCKDDPIVPDQTFEELYPDWVNLTWVSTNDVTDPAIRPQISFTITGDEVTFKYKSAVTDYTYKYDGFEVTSTTATLFLPQPGAVNQTFDILTQSDNTKIKLSWQLNEYVLQIN